MYIKSPAIYIQTLFRTRKNIVNRRDSNLKIRQVKIDLYCFHTPIVIDPIESVYCC